jgi:CHAT domain-containing protein
MRYSVKLFGLMAVLLAPIIPMPGLSASPKYINRLEMTKATKDDESTSVLLEVEGILEEGDNTFSDGILYDQYIIEGRAGQTISVTLESLNFHTLLRVFDEQGNRIAMEYDGSLFNTLNGSVPNFYSFATITLPTDGTYYVVSNVFGQGLGLSSSWLLSSQGHYRLIVVEASSKEARPLLTGTILDQIANIADRNSEANRLFGQGVQEFEANQLQSSMQSLEKALAIYREIGNVGRELITGENLVKTYQALGRYEEAIALNQQLSITLFEYIDTQGLVSDDAADLLLRGIREKGLGQPQEALQTLEQALALYRERGDRRGESAAMSSLADIYLAIGQYGRAIDFSQQALAIAREIGNRVNEAENLVSLGNIYYVVGQYEQAVDLYQQALATAHGVNYYDIEANVFSGLGSAYAAIGDYDRAIDFHQQALTIDHGDNPLVASLSSLGNIYFAVGDYERAIDFYQQVLAFYRRNIGENELGIGNRIDEGSTLYSLGNAYGAREDYERAFDFYQQSLIIARAVDDRLLEANTLSSLGATYFSINQFAQAEMTLQQSMVVLESLRTDLSDAQLIAIADTQANTYTLSVLALVAQNKTVEALAIAERGRARAFVLQLANRLTSRADQEAIATAPTIAEIQQIARDTNSTLVTYSQIFDQALYIWVVQLSGEIAFRSVEFEGSGNAGFAINPIAAIDGPVYRSAPDESELGQLVADSRASIVIESTNTRPEQLRELHTLLIDPIADLLPTDPEAKVVFVPQGNLFLVPFAALQDVEGTHLIEKHTILTAPSIQVYGLANEAASTTVGANGGSPFSADNALIVGNPTMPKVWSPNASGDFAETQLTDLPGAKAEAEAIGGFLNISPLIGPQATEARVKQLLPSARLIHLATHGLLDYGDPRAYGRLDVPGAIALTPDATEDGLLTSAEILEMDLQADLAVLSACDTGRGRITGDGVVGLSRSLITAGVPSVVVSLWAVPDAPTAELMTEFYRQLDQGQDKAQALRQAMLTTLEQHPDPRNWAAFTLIGAAE